MEIAGLWDRCIFNFVRNYQAVLQDCSTHSPVMYEDSGSISLPTFGGVIFILAIVMGVKWFKKLG